MARSKEKLNAIITNYLKRKNIYYEDPPWIIKESPLGGFGVFAKRDLLPGEFIFRDYPVILGSRFLQDIPDMCATCFSKSQLISCSKCPLSICSKNCKKMECHKKECTLMQKLQLTNASCNESLPYNLLSCITPLRSLLLDKRDMEVVRILKSHQGAQHGREIEYLISRLGMKIEDNLRDYLIFVCSVLDANAFEVVAGNEENHTSLRGLYPLGSLVNHRCYPNVSHVFDSQQRMVVRAATFIKEGDEMFHTYTRLIWGTVSRVYHLKNTKHFICNCKRCLDSTEFGTYMNAILCKKCKGPVIPVDPLKGNHWKCEQCTTRVAKNEVGHTLSLVGSILKGFTDTDFKFMYKFLTNKLSTLVWDNNETAVELKYRMIWILGHNEGYKWEELSMDLLDLKLKLCDNILTLLQKLDTGQCKMRGLLLFEKYQCLEEIKRKENNNIPCEDSQKYIKEAADILRDDVSAPKIIQDLWND